jgi:hypothetical protein
MQQLYSVLEYPPFERSLGDTIRIVIFGRKSSNSDEELLTNPVI